MILSGLWGDREHSIFPHKTPKSQQTWISWCFLTSLCAFPPLCLGVCWLAFLLKWPPFYHSLSKKLGSGGAMGYLFSFIKIVLPRIATIYVMSNGKNIIFILNIYQSFHAPFKHLLEDSPDVFSPKGAPDLNFHCRLFVYHILFTISIDTLIK